MVADSENRGPVVEPREIFATTHLPPREFYARATEDVARDLLGTTVVHQTEDGVLAGRIVEVEAYLGRDDPAAHSSAGETRRTAVVFGPPGHAYVYQIYGVHRCLNVVAEPDGMPGCVLLRALEPICGIPTMSSRRKTKRIVDIANGPAKLTSAMAIGMDCYGADLIASPLTIRIPNVARPIQIETSPRIGITKATELPLRFVAANSKHLSRR